MCEMSVRRAASGHQAPVFDHQAAILNDMDTSGGHPLRRLVVADPSLQPDEPGPGLHRENVVEVRSDLVAAPEDEDHIDGKGDLGEGVCGWAACEALQARVDTNDAVTGLS